MKAKLLYSNGLKRRVRKKRWQRWDREMRQKVKRLKGRHNRGYPLPQWVHGVLNLLIGQRVIQIAKECASS